MWLFKRKTYLCGAPSRFEEVGQHVRLYETVMEQRLGTCLDLTLLYVSCMEVLGLNPVVVPVKGYIFAGVWLVEEIFAYPIVEVLSQLAKRMADEIHEISASDCL